MNSYPRESVEFQSVTVMVDGQPTTEGISIALTQNADRPTTYTPATILEGRAGFMVQNLTPGIHRVWAEITSNPETPVLYCGYINIT